MSGTKAGRALLSYGLVANLVSAHTPDEDVPAKIRAAVRRLA